MRRGMIFLLIGGLSLMGCAVPNTSTPGDGDASDGLNASQKRAVQAVLDAVEGIGRTAAGAAPAAKAPAIQSGDLAAFACMDLVSQAATNIVDLTIEFGGACDPSLFIAGSASGSVSGSVNTDTGAVALSFVEFAVQGETTDGTWSGSSARSDGIASFSADVDLVLSVGEGILDGHVEVEVDEETGVTHIVGGTVIVVGTDFDPVVIEFDNAEIDFVANGGFSPQAGGATFTLQGDNGSDSEQFTLQFSSQTPTSDTVTVQTEDGSSFEYTEPDDGSNE